MTKANYTYRVFGKIIAINDLDMGNMSVTNDIENVVAEICNKEDINKEDFVWIYNDSEENWDGWDVLTEDFFSIRLHDLQDALISNEVQKRLNSL